MIDSHKADAKLIEIRKEIHLKNIQDLTPSLNKIAESISSFLDVARVGIWTYTENKDGIKCASLFDRKSHEHLKDITLLKVDYPKYFEAIEEDRIIEALDARTHSATSCFKESYLEPLGIYSLYDAPIWNADKVIGVICLEYINPKTNFSVTEKNFITSCADYVGKLYEKIAFFELIETLESKVIERTSELNKALYDLKAAQLAIISKEKLASLGALTAGIAHEIRNPLNLISNSALLLDSMISDTDGFDSDDKIEDIKTTVRIINKSSARAESIIQSMLDQSRNDNEFVLNDFNETINESIELAKHSARIKNDKKFDLNINLCEVKSFIFSKVSIQRVVINILENSHYSVIEKLSKDPQFLPNISITSKILKDTIELNIRDNGQGIEEENLQKLMVPFFTTKPTGKGTGLGLSMAFDIINSHNGTIEITSEVGKYFQTRICLPLKF